MLAHRRLAELQLLARRLRQVQGERTALLRARATVAHTPQQRHDTVLVLRAPSPRDARAAHAAEQLRRLDAVREALLFRRVPIALSLAERSVRAHMGVADTATTRRQRQQQPHAVATTTMDALQSQRHEQQAQPPPPQQQQQQAQLRIARVLLLALHDAERERRCLYDEKLSQLQRRCARAQQQQLQQRTSRRSGSSKHGDDDDDNKDAQAMWRAARDDVQLLQQSLLARPYMSARLWRLLLCDGVWAAAVAAQKRRQQQRQHEAHERDTTASPLLLHMCLAFSRLTLGVLHDYVHGHTVNATSPRFAVSLPSAAQRARTGDTTRKGDDDDDTNNNNNGNDGNNNNNDTASVAVTPWSEADALFGVMQQDGDSHVVSAEVTTTAATATTTIQTPRRPRRRALASLPLRWLPPHSANVVPLMLDTLALHSFVVAELPVEALVRAGHIADVLSLFVTLQKAATALLALHYDNDNDNDDAASRERLHTVLRRLEHVLLQHGVRVRDALAQQLQQASSATALLCHGGSNSSSNNATAAATTAARVLVDLDHLQLLYKRHNVADTTTTAAATTTSTTTAAVVDALQLVLFPQLRTCTRQALMARARHTALLGFATRRHRAHLLAAHGSRAGATQYLLGTVVQHARLQRRQMAAALRERYVHDAEHDAAVALARALALDDGVWLLHLCITHACDTTPSRLDGAAHTRATAPRARSHATVAAAQRRQQLQQQQEQLYATERRVAVVLLMADVVLLAASLQPRTRHGNTTRTHAFDDNDDNDKTNNNNNDNVDDDNDDDAHMQLPLALLASVWVSLTRLWPILDSRRELQRHASHRHHRGGGGATHDETALMTALTEYVLHTINDHIAQRLLRLQQQHASRARSDASVRGVVVTAADVVALATGLHDWGSVVDGGGNNDNAVAPRRPPRPVALTTLAQTTGKLVRELMLHDVALWRDVRTRSLHERQRFEQHLRTSLHTVGALDRTADTALQRICYAVA